VLSYCKLSVKLLSVTRSCAAVHRSSTLLRRTTEFPTVHFFVAHATRPGAKASEPVGVGGRNGYFTAALLPLIKDHGSDTAVQALMREVREHVSDSTRRQQLVEVRDQLMGDVFLVPSVAAIAAATGGMGPGPASKRARWNEEEGES
jgi:hypothetical protein